MLALLLNFPVVRNIIGGAVVAAGLVVGYIYWAAHERHLGEQAVIAKLQAEADQRDKAIKEQSDQIDEKTAAQHDQIQKILRRDWSSHE